MLGGPSRADSRHVAPSEITLTLGKIPDWVREYSAVETPVAMTIGYRIWFTKEGYTWHNLFHEVKHCDQFKEFSGKKFMKKYTLETLAHGYKENPFEEEAEQFAEQMTEKVENHAQ